MWVFLKSNKYRKPCYILDYAVADSEQPYPLAQSIPPSQFMFEMFLLTFSSLKQPVQSPVFSGTQSLYH